MRIFIIFSAILLLCSGCDKARLAIAGVDVPEVIDNYKPITPLLVGKATGTVVSVIKKSNQIADDIAQAIMKELCSMEKDYREYWIRRQWKKNGIDYRRACSSLDGEITDPMP